MFKLNEIKFYDKYDEINNKVNSTRNEINKKEVVLRSIESVEIKYGNKDFVTLKSVLDFKIIDDNIYFKNEIFSEKLYNNYIKGTQIDSIKVIGKVFDCYDGDCFYYELNIDGVINCRVENIKLNLNNRDMLDNVDKKNIPCMEVFVS